MTFLKLKNGHTEFCFGCYARASTMPQIRQAIEDSVSIDPTTDFTIDMTASLCVFRLYTNNPKVAEMIRHKDPAA